MNKELATANDGADSGQEIHDLTSNQITNRHAATDESMELKSRKRGPSELDITVEKAMSGVVERTVAEEAERAKEDMVRIIDYLL
jgi:hypothetical protein